MTNFQASPSSNAFFTAPTKPLRPAPHLGTAILCVALLAAGCCDNNDGPPIDNPTDGPRNVLLLNREAFHAKSVAELAAAYPGFDANQTADIWFQDFFNQDKGHIYSSIHAVYELPAAHHFAGNPHASFRSGLNGIWNEHVVVDVAELDYAPGTYTISVKTPNSAIFMFKETATAQEADAELAAIAAEFPSATFEALSEIDVYLVRCPPRDLGAIFRRIEASPLTLAIENDREVYELPLVEAPAVQIQGEPEYIDLRDYTDLSGEARNAYQFNTSPSLAAPFGPGELPGELGDGFLVVTPAGQDETACAAAISAAFPSYDITGIGDREVGFIIESSVSVRDGAEHIATVAQLPCVQASIAPHAPGE